MVYNGLLWSALHAGFFSFLKVSNMSKMNNGKTGNVNHTHLAPHLAPLSSLCYRNIEFLNQIQKSMTSNNRYK